MTVIKVLLFLFHTSLYLYLLYTDFKDKIIAFSAIIIKNIENIFIEGVPEASSKTSNI